jgi:hypothetical protein
VSAEKSKYFGFKFNEGSQSVFELDPANLDHLYGGYGTANNLKWRRSKSLSSK